MAEPNAQADALRAAHLEERLEALRDGLRGRIARSSHCSYGEESPHIPGSGGDRSYQIGVADGHRCAAREAEILLEEDDARQTRLASPSEQAPVVTALGAPGVPREAIELLEWLSAGPGKIVQFAREEHPATNWIVTAVSPVNRTGDAGRITAESAPSLAEAARAALLKVAK